MTTTRPITFEDIARLPAPGTNVPAAVRFSPNGRLVTYLYSSAGTLTRELWAYERATGREWRLIEPPAESADEASLSREEQLRRERQRQLATGITGYAWSERGETLLVRAGGDVLVRRGLDAPWRRIDDGGWVDPQLNRDGTMVAFVKDGELYALDLTVEGAPPVRLTFDATPADRYGDRRITNGLAEFVAQEEMGRASGFWWAPDGRRLAFARVDHEPVPPFFITHPGTDAVEVETHRYPFAGKDNVRVRLGVVPAAGGDLRWLDLGDDPDIYLARVHWTPDGLVLAQVESRDQTRLEVRRCDPETGRARTLWTDVVEPWVNLTDDLRFVRTEDAPPHAYTILWSSEREGRRELYLYDRDGRLLRRLTRGDVMIDAVSGVDAAGGWVYVEGWDVSPLERHLFRVPLAGGAAERLTRRPGTHRCVLAPDGTAFADTFAAADRPPIVALCALDGREAGRLQAAAPADPRLEALALRPPEFVTVAAGDGESLHAAVYRPRGLPPGRTAPVVVSVYGGPHVQRVVDDWSVTADLRAQYLAQEGFCVLKLDNRGSARRGLRFEGAIHRNLGDLEVRDQVDGVRQLTATVPEADAGRVGVYGWSYGGYMALMCLARAPDVFRAAVAGAPVTHWDGYDTHYTERYMGRPADNPTGYRLSSVMAHVANIRGRLLLVHGMIDENVHFRHTGRLMQALIDAGIPFELLAYPEERHSPRRETDRVALERRIAEFFRAALA
jgi:dipeptidyl-peptidase-4